MALQKLDIRDPWASLGESFGTGIGGGLASGLDRLAQHKMQELSHGKKVKALAKLGLPAEYADFDDRTIDRFIQQKLQEPSQQAFAQGLQSILGGGQQNSTQPEIMRQQMPQNQAFSPMTQGEQLGNKIFGNNPPPGYVPPQRQQQLPPQVQQQVQQQQQRGIPPELAARLNPQQAMQLAQLGLQKQALTKKEEKAQELFNKKQQVEVQKQADKETLPYYNKVLEEDKSAKKIDLDTARMVKLIEKGNLPYPVFYKGLKDIEESLSPLYTAGALGAAGYKIGGPYLAAAGAGLGLVLKPIVSALRYGQAKLNPDIEEFEKLSANFISGAKAIFGSRITDSDLKAFMLTVPQLTNTKSGKKSIIRNIQILNKASHARADAMKKIIKDNNGRRPLDLAIQVEEVAGPELDKLSQEFIG